MAQPLARTDIVAALRRAAEPLPFVVAMWEGGSAAWARADALSDLDLQLLVDDDHVGDALRACEDALVALSTIELRFEVPQPTWHGHDQVFYQLADAGEFLLVDLAVMKRSSRNPLSETERHGERQIVFDKTGEAAGTALDPVRHREALDRTLARLRVTFPMFQCLPKKELLRGNEVAALAFYQSHTLQPLLTLLRIRHCPERFDFGPKYARTDLPPAVYEEVRALFFVASAAELGEKRERAEALFWETLRRIDDAEK